MSLLHLLLFTGRSLVVLDFADFGGLERFAVAVVVVCRRLQADELSVMFCVIFGSVGWRVDVNSESEQSVCSSRGRSRYIDISLIYVLSKLRY